MAKQTKKQDYNRIKAVLAEKKKTGKWLAEQMKMDRGTISGWCTNRIQPSIETLFVIAKILGVNVRNLINPTEEKNRLL